VLVTLPFATKSCAATSPLTDIWNSLLVLPSIELFLERLPTSSARKSPQTCIVQNVLEEPGTGYVRVPTNVACILVPTHRVHHCQDLSRLSAPGALFFCGEHPMDESLHRFLYYYYFTSMASG